MNINLSRLHGKSVEYDLSQLDDLNNILKKSVQEMKFIADSLILKIDKKYPDNNFITVKGIK